MDPENKTQSIPYKSKVAYELVFLEAIKDVRKQRVNHPTRGFINAVIALELVLLPVERKDVVAYKLDHLKHEDTLEKLAKELSAVEDLDLQQKIRTNRIKEISWPLYCKELDRLYSEGNLVDQDFNKSVNKTDLNIMKYTGLLEKIIEILKNNDWLIKGGNAVMGGGGHGLDEYEEEP